MTTEPTPAPERTSDLPKRAASAVVMVAVAGAALWAGGGWLRFFIYAVGLACFVELVRLVLRASFGTAGKAVGIIGGAVYIGLAGLFLADIGRSFLIEIMLGVIATDVGAYFAGRTIGGPKIAPRISPSKTWAGLGGGALLAALVLVVEAAWSTGQQGVPATEMLFAAIFGMLIAMCAQAGDFLESWLKRRAGVKDSSNLIPGHGGVFDRIDGLIAVAFTLALFVNGFGVI